MKILGVQGILALKDTTNPVKIHSHKSHKCQLALKAIHLGIDRS